MKFEVTIERLVQRPNRPARWAVHVTGKFNTQQEVAHFMTRSGIPAAPEVGWAFRIATLP